MSPNEKMAAVENESGTVNVSHRQRSWLLFKALSEVEIVIETNSKVWFLKFIVTEGSGPRIV